MRYIPLLAAALLSCAVSVPALAGPAFEVGVAGGGRFFEGEEDFIYGLDLDMRSPTLTLPAPEFGLRVDWLATEKVFVEFEALYANPVTMRRTSPIDETQFRLGLGYNIHSFKVARSYGTLTPNIMAFVGGRDLRNDLQQQTRGAFTLGTGVRYNCGRMVVRADLRHTLSAPNVSMQPYNDFDVTAGVGVLIGGDPVPCGPAAYASEKVDALAWVEPTPAPPVAAPVEPAIPVEPEPLFVPGVRFPHDSIEITAGNQATLDDVVDLLNENPDLRLEVQGYTDNTGTEVYNDGLSISRAEVVRAYLVVRGIAPERLRVVGFGQLDPVGDNGTEDGRWANRRVTFRVLE